MPFGVVERDARGEPTGLLTEFATTGLAGAGHQALAAVLPWGSPAAPLPAAVRQPGHGDPVRHHDADRAAERPG